MLQKQRKSYRRRDKKALSCLVVGIVLMSAVPWMVAAQNAAVQRSDEALKDILASETGGKGDNIVPRSGLPIYEFLTYANFGINNSCYTPGQGVGGYKNKLYVATYDQYCYVYEVSIPEGEDPNMHPDNPEAPGPIAPRNLTFIEKHDILADIGGSIHQSKSEFYVDDTGIYYGPAPGGIHKWNHNWNYQGKVVDVSLASETLAYDANNDVWYAGLSNRDIYSFRPGTDTSWQYEFTYPDYVGGHHDGLEFVNGFLWISDMTSNWVGQWKKDSTGLWNETARYNYDTPIDDDVEGMGFGAFGHLWATGWSRLYEIGGKELGTVLGGINVTIALDKAEYYPTEMMKISARVIDTKNSTPYPLVDKMQVKIDENDVNIESSTVQPDDTILIKVRAPVESGNHTVEVVAATNIGTATDSKNFTVKTEAITGTVSVSSNGTVDSATKTWKYSTKYNAPVFRRGTDDPTFILDLEAPLPEGYEVVFKIYDANGDLTARHRPTGKLMNKYYCYWQWDDDIALIVKPSSFFPIGKYTVKPTVVDSKCGNNIDIASTDDFYVIFEFDEGMYSFVTWERETDYWEGSLHNIYDLHMYDYPQIWINATEWANGAVTVQDAVNKTSELARRIDGRMVYHHARINESNTSTEIGNFVTDEYDNDFDGRIDLSDDIGSPENWTQNYEPYREPSPNSNKSGRAYDTSKVTKICIPIVNICFYYYDSAWVDGKGKYYNDKLKADKIAWYFDTIKMLKEDFDPEDRIPDQTVSEPHQHSVGVCEDYSMLTVAYLRSIGIPSRVATGNLSAGHRGHAWLQWYENGEWHHLDVDHITPHSYWEENKYNAYFYDQQGYPPTWVYVRNSEDINDVSDIVDQYRQATTTEGTLTAQQERSTICNYDLLGPSELKAGEDAAIKINITNPTNESKTANVAIVLMSPSIGGSPTPIAFATKKVTVPANLTITEEITLTIPSDATPGDYSLRIYEEEHLALETPIKISTKYTVLIELPKEVIYQEPFEFRVAIENNATTPIHDVAIALDTHYYFNTTGTEPLRKEIPILNANKSHRFNWMLTPIWHGDLRIDVTVSTSDAGSETKIVSVPVLQTPKLSITPTVPEKVKKGDDFFLNAMVFNSGDLSSDAVNLSITTPPNVTAADNKTSVDLGIIDAHKNKIYTFKISQNESEDFAILLNASSTNATAENYAFVNIIQPNMFVDILNLKEGETPGTEQHTDVVETLADEPCNLTIYIKNTGDEDLSNVQILTNVGVTENVSDINEKQNKSVPIEFTPTTPGLSGFNVTVKSDEIERTVTRTLLVEKFNLTVSTPKTEYDQNEPVPIDISVKNEVPGIRFIDFKIEINISNSNYSQTFEIPLLSLAPFVTVTKSCSWDTTGVDNGTYRIVSSLVMAGREVASDEEQVGVGETLPPPLQPDLTLASEDISFSPASQPTEGDPVTINATVHNIGGADASDFTVSFFDGASLIGTATISAAANSATTASTTWTAVAGDRTIKVVADSGGAVAESDETNNEANKTITVKEKAVVVSPVPSYRPRRGGGGGGGGSRDTDGDGVSDVDEILAETDWKDASDYPGKAKEEAAVTPTPTPSPAPTLTPTVTPAQPTTPTAVATPTSTPTTPTPQKKVPGFEASLAVFGLLGVAYLLGRRRVHK